MTLGGLALAVGILVDDATVEIENIVRYTPLRNPQTLINTTSADLLDTGRHSHYISHCRGQHFQTPAFSLLLLLLPLR